MKLTNLLPLLAATLTAAAKHNPFSGLALRSASPIHFASVEARDGALHLRGKTKTFCPQPTVPNCPPGNTTELLFSRRHTNKAGLPVGGLSMNVEVPGGQQVYVDKTGRMRYTIAHSGFIPPGSITGGFVYEAGAFGGNQPFADRLSHPKGGFVACPGKGKGKNTYRVYVARKGFKAGKGCLGFDWLAQNTTGIAAWQYE
jgi:hypothetical protein